MKKNPEKTVSANSNGIVISYRDVNKKTFIPYENEMVNAIQTVGTVRYQKIETTVQFSPKQKELYQKVVYGFKAYTPQEISEMSEKKKIDVTTTYTKANRILRKWKQDMVFNALDDMLSTLFPKSKIVEQMVQTKGYIEEGKEEIPFKDLGVPLKNIADRLIQFGLLPKNFYQLT